MSAPDTYTREDVCELQNMADIPPQPSDKPLVGRGARPADPESSPSARL
jgi:hypothetical protein